MVKLNSDFTQKEVPLVFDLNQQIESCFDLYISSLVLNTYDYYGHNNYSVFVNCDGAIKTIELMYQIITIDENFELYNDQLFEIIHNITNKTKEVIIDEFLEGFYQIDKIYKFSGNNYNITISPTGINELDKIGTYIDFSRCENKLRNYYSLSSWNIITELIIVPINTNEQNLINNIKYRLFSEYGELNLTICLDEKIVIYYQSNTTIKNISSTISISNTMNDSTVVTPKFTYYSVDIDNYINGYYYFYINGNMDYYSNNFKYNIDLVPTKVIGVFYNASCSGEVTQSSYYNFRFKCWFKPPQRYLGFIEIYEPALFKDFELLNWPNQPIAKYKEIVSSDYVFYIKDYNYSETCDMYSESFTFEIEMESFFKQGYLISKTILLSITEPSKIGPATCYLQNDNLNSNVKFKCNIYNLTQENRITNGIKIGGIYKKNITDEYLVTRDNIYIKLIDLDKIQFQFIECP